MPLQKRFKKIWPIILMRLPGMLLVLLLLWSLSLTLLWSWVAKPPALPNHISLEKIPVYEKNGRRWVGPCWLETIQGLHVLYLEGEPVATGYANSMLTGHLMHRQEDALSDLVRTYIPSTFAQNMIKFILTFHARRLPDFISLDHRLEILGLTLGCPDIHPELGPYYHRLINYHAAHDLSHLAVDRAWLSGCTSFGAWGALTHNNLMLTGRNFDWEAAPVFERDRVLILYRPAKGIPFVSFAWAGMIGAVSGMNQAGVSVTLNGARGKPPTSVGTPIALVARQILQEARNLDDAVRIVSNSTVFVSELFLVGSHTDGRFVVIEKTPTHTAVREGTNSRIICANHFESESLKNDPNNLAFLADSTSEQRHDRMSELIEQNKGSLAPEHVVEILRDRCLAGGIFPGNGHRAALNALIATHSVVMNLSDGIFWAATPPHQLGSFIAVDVKAMHIASPDQWFPPDSMLASGEYAAYTNARQLTAQACVETRTGLAGQAIATIEQAALDNPGFYKVSWAKADALLKLGRTNEACAAYKTALDAHPAFPSEKEDLIRIISVLTQP